MSEVNNIEYARTLKNQMKSRRCKVNGTLKDICILINARETGNYEEVFKTKLYNVYSVEYCEYLELLH